MRKLVIAILLLASACEKDAENDGGSPNDSQKAEKSIAGCRTACQGAYKPELDQCIRDSAKPGGMNATECRAYYDIQVYECQEGCTNP